MKQQAVAFTFAVHRFPFRIALVSVPRWHAEVLQGCWRVEDYSSRFFFCCGNNAGAECWENKIALGSPEVCCERSRVDALETKVAASRAVQQPSPCGLARARDDRAWRFVETVAERLLWEGRLFAEDDDDQKSDEVEILRDLDAVYEACAPAALLALLSATGRRLASRDWARADALHLIYTRWEALPWTAPLTWLNLLDPLVFVALESAVSHLKMLSEMFQRPQQFCDNFLTGIRAMVYRTSPGLSMTVSITTAENLEDHSTLAQCAAALASYASFLPDAHVCSAAKLFAHTFVARQLLDLKPSIAYKHAFMISELAKTSQLKEVITRGDDWAIQFQLLLEGFLTQKSLLDMSSLSTVPPSTSLSGAFLGPLAIWETGLSASFSEGYKDAVLERIYGLLGMTNRFYVEVGTQDGIQCNSRFLRVRYGFRGIMLDDNFKNADINQFRHFVTPTNFCDLLRQYNTPHEFDLLSLDTDGNEWLLWLEAMRAGFLPQIVVIEFNSKLPFDQDLLVRYSPYPLHRMCLVRNGRFSTIRGGSFSGMLALGRLWGYHAVHLARGDMIFVRGESMKRRNLVFPAQDDWVGLCALARYQDPSKTSSCHGASLEQVSRRPVRPEVFTTASAAVAGDVRLHKNWSIAMLQEVFC